MGAGKRRSSLFREATKKDPPENLEARLGLARLSGASMEQVRLGEELEKSDRLDDAPDRLPPRPGLQRGKTSCPDGLERKLVERPRFRIVWPRSPADSQEGMAARPVRSTGTLRLDPDNAPARALNARDRRRLDARVAWQPRPRPTPGNWPRCFSPRSR